MFQKHVSTCHFLNFVLKHASTCCFQRVSKHVFSELGPYRTCSPDMLAVNLRHFKIFKNLCFFPDFIIIFICFSFTMFRTNWQSAFHLFFVSFLLLLFFIFLLFFGFYFHFFYFCDSRKFLFFGYFVFQFESHRVSKFTLHIFILKY